jgi:hypothetical protein
MTILMRCLRLINIANPVWRAADLFHALDVVPTPDLIVLAHNAGFIRECGYGEQPYGSCAYGRHRGVSRNGTVVKRRVSHVGQFHYRGKRYTLGVDYRSCTASIVEVGTELVLTFNDRPNLRLSLRSAPS